MTINNDLAKIAIISCGLVNELIAKLNTENFASPDCERVHTSLPSTIPICFDMSQSHILEIDNNIRPNEREEIIKKVENRSDTRRPGL
ncbi:hypothetical protein BLNAU_13225 [Blattamonas nauphoetae]|uniref:Uncharacterized protein n=1 Tax=Blattamonas nauphoetae TaxID=2049346 RepID=A0ABQ9XKX5_9EUKA|nr:hypothetical protein BLNAU_13225 [Blattamonas nauphoetae]